MRSALGKLYLFWWFIVFSTLFIILYPLFLILLSTPRLYVAANYLRYVWGKLLCLFTGIWPRITYKGALPKGAAIYCPNHFSYMDIVMMSFICKGRVCFMAKAELANIPLFGIFFSTVDIAVNRSSRTQSFDAFAAVKERLLQGYSVVIFPEGTIHGKAPRMGAFKNGPFKLATDTGLPLVPVTFTDNFKRIDIDTRFGGSPGIARAIVHAPLYAADTSDAAEILKTRTFELLQQDLHNAHGHNA